MWVRQGISGDTSKEQYVLLLLCRYKCSNCVIGFHIAGHSNLAVYNFRYIYPLSSPFCPNFFPISPTTTPGKACSVFGSLTGVTNECRPCLVPSCMTSWAYTMAWVAVLPRIPTQHLVASKSGVWRTNSCIRKSLKIQTEKLLTGRLYG